MRDHRLPSRDPRQRPRKGDVFLLDGVTITVERIDFDGTGARRWSSWQTRIHCAIHDPRETRPELRDHKNDFSPRDFISLMRTAMVVREHGKRTGGEEGRDG